MPTFTNPSFVIKVMVVGRKEIIASHSYGTREEAEADLSKITEARQRETDVQLAWLQMPGQLVQAAFIDDQTSAFSLDSFGNY